MVAGEPPARGSQPSHFRLFPQECASGQCQSSLRVDSAPSRRPVLRPAIRYIECQPLVPSDRGGTNPVPTVIGPPLIVVHDTIS